MPGRSFTDDAVVAETTSLPVPRGIAFLYEPVDGPPTLAGARTVAAGPLPGWEIRQIEGLTGWYEAITPAVPGGATAPAQPPPAPSQPMPLGDFWSQLRTFKSVPGVRTAEPLLLVANPVPANEVESEAFALGYGQEQFALWGQPYDDDVEQEIARVRTDTAWHLAQLNVRDAWSVWRAKHPNPGRELGDGIVVGHPDTGYSDHPEVAARWKLPGRSFLRDENGNDVGDGRDDLRETGEAIIENPGHGTATASVIASGERDQGAAGAAEVYGVAPGARVLPLRVSRSVVHFDFSNVGRAILHAVAANADVISMSLGGPWYSTFARECIRHAHDQGVIVIAAAGNQVPTTVFPAAFPEVIAVAATHPARAPWRFSGLGRLVDIASPGEDVWRARAGLDRGNTPSFSAGPGTGTSFATACVAGLAALWLSHHGGRDAVAAAYGGRKGLVPFAFQYLLARTADSSFEWVRKGKYGAGIPNARALLETPLPSQPEVERFEQIIRAQPVSRFTVISGLFSGGLGVTDQTAVTLTADATADPRGTVRTGAVGETDAVVRAVKEQQAEQDMLRRLLGPRAEELADELVARIAADRMLLVGLQRWRQGESALPLLDQLVRGPGAADSDGPPPALSDEMRRQLQEQRQKEEDRLLHIHRGRLEPGISVLPASSGPPPPAFRRLRAYAFDPSLETKLETAPINQITIPTRWEDLRPGPIGAYLEVVDIDPSSGCAYSPVDLDHPHLLGQDGLPPSEGNPQFHQQMVYTVAMNTIHRFEVALGRPIFWSPLRPWLRDRPAEQHRFTREALAAMGMTAPGMTLPAWSADRDRYVQRLRVYPHALREANAYYSPRKRALLFGYFPGANDDTGRHYPGGMVFTSLSHDIIAHETTHALLDGMHPYFNEPSNEDVWAFHEAFADIMALFQHFTFPDVLRHQIANTRGELQTDNLLGQLAQQFGEATGTRGALRNALGGYQDGVWERHTPDPRRLRTIGEPHERGSILIAAVFDAFLKLYNDRIADLLRIYTGGTGVLPAGRLHPDLVNRLAGEAAQTAEDVLRICIRAMDFVPPVDITFGEFLRALITADYELAPTERRQNRIAFIDAFRSWGIYPRDVPTLSEDSLRWRGPSDDAPLKKLTEIGGFADSYERTLANLVPALDAWQPGSDRGAVFQRVQEAQARFHSLLVDMLPHTSGQQSLLPGLDLSKGFSVGNLRPARRIGLQGEFRTEMVVEVVQTHRPPGGDPAPAVPFRGGATLIVDLRDWTVRYVIYKRLYERLPDGGVGVLTNRFERQRRFEQIQRAGAAGAAQAAWQGEDTGNLAEWLAATYACEARTSARRTKQTRDEPFALLHRSVE
jgi:hypothetical protein